MGSIAFFDFDGTITTKDSFSDFIQYAVGKRKYYLGIILNLPLLIAFKFKVLPNYVAKEKLFAYFFRGWRIDVFQKMADGYSIEQVDTITRPEAMKKVNWHKQQGHKVVVVTASMENWIKLWCLKNHLDLIATSLEVSNNELTGKFASKNCYSVEKVKRIIEKYNLTDYDRVYAYGDSRGDEEMLNLASEKFFRRFE